MDQLCEKVGKSRRVEPVPTNAQAKSEKARRRMVSIRRQNLDIARASQEYSRGTSKKGRKNPWVKNGAWRDWGTRLELKKEDGFF